MGTNPYRHVAPAAVAGSVLLHGLLLAAIGRWYASPRPEARADGSAGEITYVAIPVPRVVPPVDRGPRAVERPPPEPRAVPLTDTASATAATLGPAPAGSSRPTTAVAALRPGFSDPRLHLPAGALRPAAGISTTMEERFADSLRADDERRSHEAESALDRRQTTLFGRKVTLFGGPEAARWSDLSAVLSGERMVMPTDGREWENRELRRQSQNFVRDSILRERARATRQRKNAERSSD